MLKAVSLPVSVKMRFCPGIAGNPGADLAELCGCVWSLAPKCIVYSCAGWCATVNERGPHIIALELDVKDRLMPGHNCRQLLSHWALTQTSLETATLASISWAAIHWPPSSLRARWTTSAAPRSPSHSCWTTPTA